MGRRSGIPNTRYTEADIAKIRQLSEAGLNTSAIAKSVHRSQGSVWYVCRTHDIPINPGSSTTGGINSDAAEIAEFNARQEMLRRSYEFTGTPDTHPQCFWPDGRYRGK
jgi:hypothetical protein